MDIEQKDYHKLPFSRLFCDFIDGKPETAPFFRRQHNYQQLREAITTYRFPGDRSAAADIIRNFNNHFTLDTAARENIEALSNDQTVTITTGQQVSLLGGPLYTIFKTLSVVHLAQSLSHSTGRKVVPVFWLADEDHDFEEIATVKLPSSDSLQTITLPCDSCARHAAGNIVIDDAFESFQSEIFENLPETDFHDDLKALVSECYVSGRSLRQAFGELLARLFSRHGLILAGSNFKEAKVFTKEKLRLAIERADEISNRLSDQSEQVARTYHQQAQVLDSLLFWHDEKKGRVRLVRNNGFWSREPDVTLSTEELLEKLESEPEKFSPNVFLRPILQDTLLPNAAYVGGPAEIAYYGQMKQLYDLFDQPMPFLAGRLSATLIEPPIARILNGLPYDLPDFSGRIEDLEQQYLRNYGDPDLDHHFDKWKEQIEQLSEQMSDKIGITDPGLRKHCQAITKDHQKSIDKLRKKMGHVVRKKEEVQITRIKKVKKALFPGNRLQERELAFIYIMNKYGVDIWDSLLEELHNKEVRMFTRHYTITL